MDIHRTHALLIIEDNPLLAEMYRSAFEKRGVDVTFTHDGKTGLRLAAEHRPCAVLLDLLMPGMDGFSVLEHLKANPDTSKVPVTVLSILKDDESRERVQALGAAHYLVKTDVSLKDIVDRVVSTFAHEVAPDA